MKREPASFMAVAAAAVLAAGLLALSPLRADSTDTLDGWGGLRFGMTLDEARGVAGYTWSKPEQANVQAKDGATVVWTVLRSKAQVTFAGKSFALDVNFDDKGSLNQIKLKRQEPATAFATCDAAFAKLLAEGERQFGLFRPVEPAHAQKHDAKTEHETGASDWLTAIEHRSAPEGKSTYERLLMKWRRTDKLPWHVYHIDNAVRPFSNSYVELMASLDPKEPCELFLGFAAGPYPFKK